MDVLTPLREVASLRERKKAATRLALHEAVVELALAKGLDAVTVDEVADHANVSRRTFSNYFPNKEEAFLYKETLRFRQLVDRVRERPPGESAWQAMVNSAHMLIEGMVGLDPVRLSQLRLIRRHPSLAAHLLAMQYTVERDLAEAITARCVRSAKAPAHHPGPAGAASSSGSDGAGRTDAGAGTVAAAGSGDAGGASDSDLAAHGGPDDEQIAMALRARVLAAVFLGTVRAAMAVWTETPETPPAQLLTQALQCASLRLR